jgi:hypothetical protein
MKGRRHGDKVMASLLGILLVVLLVALILGALPVYPYSRGWGYRPMGLVSLLLIILLVLLLAGFV